MGYFSSYSRFMSRIYDNIYTKPTTTKDMLVDNGTNEYVEVNLYTSDELWNRNRRTSEKVAARFIARVFEKAGINYTITRGYDTVPAPSERATCGGSNPRQWWSDELDAGRYDKAKDSNILLLDASGGGCANPSNKPFACTAAARYIDEDKEYTKFGRDMFGRNMSAVLHEMGHNLALSHDMDYTEPGKQHTGTGWNDHDAEEWYRTPMNVDNGVGNLCNEWVEEREYDEVVNLLYYNDCSIEHFKLQ